MVYEPMTLLTDVLLAGWALLLGTKLLSDAQSSLQRYWGWGLVMTAAAALTGGVWHGFSPHWNSFVVVSVWRLVLLFIGAADTLLGLAAASEIFPGRVQRWIRFGILSKAGLFVLLLVWFDGFWLAVADYLPTLLLILLLHVRGIKRSVASRWMVSGVVGALFAAGIQAGELSLAAWFNHNDLYHLVQGLALFAFYRGVVCKGRLKAEGEDSPGINP